MNEPDCQLISISPNEIEQDLKSWLEQQAKVYSLIYLLAHAEDGVIWGKFENNQILMTSHDAFPMLAQLRSLTLQQCRVFGDNGEVMLWKTQQSWKARLIKDDNLNKNDYICESQILWGTQKEGQEVQGFTLLSDGSQGLQHAVPITGIQFSNDSKDLYRPVRLKVHHYINYDDSGVARIYLSRLVSLYSI